MAGNYQFKVRDTSARSELAGFLARPALNHDFGVGVKLHRVFALGVQYTEEAFFPSIEGEIGHGRGDADVDSDVSGRRFVAELARRCATGCEKRSLVAIGALADELDGFIDGI